MDIETWLYYALAIIILSASPGPSVLLCMTKAVTEGFRASMFTAFGSLTAIVSVMTLSFSGLGVIISTSEVAFSIIKWSGAVYLIYLGYRAFTSKQESYKITDQISDPEQTQPKATKKSLYLSGFIVGASNPKAIVFFTALFPQFINTAEPLLFQYLVFAITFAIIELSWLTIYSYLGMKSSNWLLQKGRAKYFNRITGGVFVGAGVFLSTSSRASS